MQLKVVGIVCILAGVQADDINVDQRPNRRWTSNRRRWTFSPYPTWRRRRWDDDWYWRNRGDYWRRGFNNMQDDLVGNTSNQRTGMLVAADEVVTSKKPERKSSMSSSSSSSDDKKYTAKKIKLRTRTIPCPEATTTLPPTVATMIDFKRPEITTISMAMPVGGYYGWPPIQPPPMMMPPIYYAPQVQQKAPEAPVQQQMGGYYGQAPMQQKAPEFGYGQAPVQQKAPEAPVQQQVGGYHQPPVSQKAPEAPIQQAAVPQKTPEARPIQQAGGYYGQPPKAPTQVQAPIQQQQQEGYYQPPPKEAQVEKTPQQQQQIQMDGYYGAPTKVDKAPTTQPAAPPVMRQAEAPKAPTQPQMGGYYGQPAKVSQIPAEVKAPQQQAGYYAPPVGKVETGKRIEQIQAPTIPQQGGYYQRPVPIEGAKIPQSVQPQVQHVYAPPSNIQQQQQEMARPQPSGVFSATMMMTSGYYGDSTSELMFQVATSLPTAMITTEMMEFTTTTCTNSTMTDETSTTTDDPTSPLTMKNPIRKQAGEASPIIPERSIALMLPAAIAALIWL